MGNCQAAEAATAVLQHPGGKLERMYWSVSASEVMGSNPGHYVAVVVAPPPHQLSSSTSGAAQPAQRHLKLLRPDDTLHIGQVYRLISFEEVLKEFASKKHMNLSRLLLTQQQKEKGIATNTTRNDEERRRRKRERARALAGESSRAAAAAEAGPSISTEVAVEEQHHQQRRQEEVVEDHTMGDGISGIGSSVYVGRRYGGQWRPALQSIAEVGS